MSGIRSFFGKLPRPSGRQAAVGGAVSAVLAGGAWYLQQNTVYGRDTTIDKIQNPATRKRFLQGRAAEEAMNKEADAKPLQAAGEEAAGK